MITTATLTTGSVIHLAIHYSDTGMSATRESQVRLLHFENDRWVDATDYGRVGGFLDTVHNIVYGRTTSLSPFAIVLPAVIHGTIDVKPGDSANVINLKSNGKVPVAQPAGEVSPPAT